MDVFIEISHHVDGPTYTTITALCKFLNKYIPEDNSTVENMCRTLGSWRLGSSMNPIASYSGISPLKHPSSRNCYWKRELTCFKNPTQVFMDNSVSYYFSCYYDDDKKYKCRIYVNQSHWIKIYFSSDYNDGKYKRADIQELCETILLHGFTLYKCCTKSHDVSYIKY